MSRYHIDKRVYDNALKNNLNIKASTTKNKKIDVYKNNEFIKSIGAIGYGDYPSYLKIDKDLAEKKRLSYIARHKNSPPAPIHFVVFWGWVGGRFVGRLFNKYYLLIIFIASFQRKKKNYEIIC